MNNPVIGILWGDFPWDKPPRRFGKLLSWGSVARTFTRALSEIGTVVPYQLSRPDMSPDEQRPELASFLASIDLLWADFYPASGAALRLRAELGLSCPALLFAGGTLPKAAEALLFPWRHLLRSDDVLIFSCRADQEIWHELVKWSALREYVVPCAVDLDVFHPGESTNASSIRVKRGLPPASPLLLYVGRRNIQKNLHTLLRLFQTVREEVPDAHLCLIGEDDDIRLAEFGVRNTGYRIWLERLAAELGIAGGITFLDPLSPGEVAEIYRTSDLVVNLSVYHRENFGLAPAEAQSCGVPAICSDWGGFREVVKHGETGYLLDTIITKHGVRVNWRAGADHALLLLHDSRQRREMGIRAAAAARERFGIDRVSEELRRIVTAIRWGDRKIPPRAPECPYEPSDFARRYEEHKKDCGWYADDDGATSGAPHWYPRMFEGRDYELYETLMRPYATELAQDLMPQRIRPEWVPYRPAGVQLDAIRQIVRDPDPIWPHERHLDALEWGVCRHIDGVSSVASISQAIDLAGTSLRLEDFSTILWHLFVEGFILLHTPAGTHDAGVP